MQIFPHLLALSVLTLASGASSAQSVPPPKSSQAYRDCVALAEPIFITMGFFYRKMKSDGVTVEKIRESCDRPGPYSDNGEAKAWKRENLGHFRAAWTKTIDEYNPLIARHVDGLQKLRAEGDAKKIADKEAIIAQMREDVRNAYRALDIVDREFGAAP